MREEGERCKIVLFRSITNTYLHILCIVEINQYPTYNTMEYATKYAQSHLEKKSESHFQNRKKIPEE